MGARIRAKVCVLNLNCASVHVKQKMSESDKRSGNAPKHKTWIQIYTVKLVLMQSSVIYIKSSSSLVGLLLDFGLDLGDLLLSLLHNPGILLFQLLLVFGRVGHILKSKVAFNLVEVLAFEKGGNRGAAELEQGRDVEEVCGHQQLSGGIEVKGSDELTVKLVFDENLGVLAN